MFWKGGSLAVAGGRDIAPLINDLLSLPFTLKIATRDFHPSDHISFDRSHSPPNDRAFESSVTTYNPYDDKQSYEVPIWPVHCVQGTDGAEIISEIDVSKFDLVIDKGKDSRVEMFSAFGDVFGNESSIASSADLAALLKAAEITDLFVVGLAGDHCVRCTALDGRKEGFEVFVIVEATRSVDAGEQGWGPAKEQLQAAGARIIYTDSPEVRRVKGLSPVLA